MVTLIVVLLGLTSLLRIQIDLLPDIELPTVSVRTEYAGASPEVMEKMVTQIIEEIVATVPGVIEIRSQSSQGNSSVQITFGWGTDVDTAALDVRSKLEDELSELPEEIDRPQVRKFDISSFPVVLLGISSELDPVELTEIVENQLRQRFSRIPNIAQVDLWGGYPREVRVELDLDRVQALQLPLSEILTAIRDANVDVPTGQIDEGRHQVTLRAPADYRNLDEIRQTVVAVRDGAAVTIGQIAEVRDTYEKLTRMIRINGELGIRLAIRKQADANTVEVANQVLEEVEAINAEYELIDIVPVINQGNFIERSIRNVARSVLYGGGLAILVLLVFLLDWRSTAAIALAIPISIAGAFTLIYGAGLTLNLTTLGGLALGIGMMVDSSIVVLENIFRRRDELGEDVNAASVEGANEVAGALVASTLTTLVVFLPLAFVRGISGVLFRELAYVVAFSLVAALLASLSLLPVLAAKLLGRVRRDERPAVLPASAKVPQSAGADPGARRDGAFARRARAAVEALTARYLVVLEGALERPGLTVAGAALLFGSSLALIPLLGTEFLPPSDEGEVRIVGEMEVGTNLPLLDRKIRQLEKLVFPAVPEADSSVVTVGASGRNPQAGYQGEIQLSLPAATERDRSNVEIARDLREELDGQIAGVRVRVRAPQGSFLLERLLRTEEGLQIEVRGFELGRLQALAERAAELAKTVPGITDVQLSREEGVPQQQIRIDREKIASLGLTVRDVTRVLQTAVAGAEAGEFRSQGNSHRILVQLADVESIPLDDLLGLTLTTAQGAQVALRNLVTTEPGLGPIIIERKNQQRLVTVSANVAGRDLGSVAEDVDARLRQIPRPKGYEIRLTGAFEEQQSAFRELLMSLALAVMLVYMVLASQYESLKDPLVVMLSVPLAAIGVISLLLSTGTTLNIQSYIGCIMVGGIVVNNAILLVDQANQLCFSGAGAREAVVEAGRRRLRPILMTTLTTIIGLLPLALGVGEGADAQAPLARAVVGGLLGSTPITLVLIPVVYLLMHPRRARGRA